MRYEFTARVFFDLGRGVCFENVDQVKEELESALLECLQHAEGDVGANLANGDVYQGGGRWHGEVNVFEVLFVRPVPDDEAAP